MEPSRQDTRSISRIPAFCLGLLLTACIADPWPEPDEGTKGSPAPAAADDDNGGTLDADVDADADGDMDGDTDGEWGDTDDGSEGWDAGIGIVSVLNQMYCSAPGTDGQVTVMGLAGSVIEYDEVSITNNGETYPVTVGRDGGFVQTLPATAGDTLAIAVSLAGEVDVTTLIVAERTREDDEVFSALELRAERLDGDILVHGEGGILAGGGLVVGGNRDESTARGAPISCNDAGCLFDLFIPGGSGDVIELFLVSSSEQSGYSEVFTVTVP